MTEYKEWEKIEIGEITHSITCPNCLYQWEIDLDQQWLEAGEENTDFEYECPDCETTFPVEFRLNVYWEADPTEIRVGKYKDD